MTSLHDALHSVGKTCDEARWLAEPDSPSAVETLGLPEESLQTLPDATRLRMIREVGTGDAHHVMAKLPEVIAYEWLRRLSLNPILIPNQFAPMSPDLSFEVDSHGIPGRCICVIQSMPHSLVQIEALARDGRRR